MLEVLDRAWTSPFKTKSDFARQYADHIAMAASDGFLTTKLATGLYTRMWQITPKGLSYLFILKGMSHD